MEPTDLEQAENRLVWTHRWNTAHPEKTATCHLDAGCVKALLEELADLRMKVKLGFEMVEDVACGATIESVTKDIKVVDE